MVKFLKRPINRNDVGKRFIDEQGAVLLMTGFIPGQKQPVQICHEMFSVDGMGRGAPNIVGCLDDDSFAGLVYKDSITHPTNPPIHKTLFQCECMRESFNGQSRWLSRCDEHTQLALALESLGVPQDML